MVVSISKAFTPYQYSGITILRPMLQITLKKGDIEFPTSLLIDSGADYSMLRTDMVEDYLLTNLNSLKKGKNTAGIGGETEIGWIDLKVIFSHKGTLYEEDIPFQVPLDPSKNPPLPLIGRDPFFYRYRIDFRMGFTDDPTLGKFVIYPESHKRKANQFRRPTKIKK